MKRILAVILVAVLFLTACQPGQITSSLEAVITAAEIALPVIAAATGIPQLTIRQILAYLNTVDAGIVQASTILAGPGTSAEKSAAIVKAFADIAHGCGCIPPGTPMQIVNVVEGVAIAVATFLSHFQSPALSPVMQGRAPAPAKPLPPIKIGRSDREALEKIRTRAEQQLHQLNTLKVKP